MNDAEVRQRYRCLAGHDVPSHELVEASKIVLLDGRAEVRVCREHGCPIAVSREATSRTPDAPQ